MDENSAYLVIRSTYRDPRHYGARLMGEDDSDCGYMISTDFDEDVWDQAARLVTSAFGKEKWQRLEFGRSTTSADVPFAPCAYVIDSNAKCPRLDMGLGVDNRIPGTHPDEDIWDELGDINEVIKVEHDGRYWYVALVSQDPDAYLIIARDIADKSLRKAAVLSEVFFK